MVRKTFMLHFPPIKGWKLRKILMTSECTYLNGEMKKHDLDMYEYSTDVPEELFSVSYRYECHLKPDNFFNNIKGSFLSNPPVNTVRFYLKHCSVQRDTWITAGWKCPDPHSFDRDSLNAHLADLLYHCPTNNILDACKQIEILCFIKLPLEHALQLLQTLATHLPSSRELSKLLFLVVIGNILSEPSLIIKERLFEKEIAQNILLALGHFELENLPSGIEKTLYPVLHPLCRIIFGSSMNLMQYLNMCYPFIDDAFILQKCQYYIKDVAKIPTESTQSVYALFNKLSNKAFRGSSQNAEKVLELLLRHLPFNMILSVISRMRASSESSLASEFENLVYSTVEIRIEKILRDVTKKRDIKGLTDLWENVTANHRSDEKLKSRFEEAFMCILGSYYSTAEVDLPAMVVDFVLRFNLFQNESTKEKLINTITDSQNHEVLELFVILAQFPEMKEQYLLVSSDRFQTFCLRYVTGYVLAERDTAFKKFCMRICKIWGLSSVTKNAENKDILVKICQSELDKYRLKDIVKQLKFVDEISESNRTIADALIEHIKGSLRESSYSAEDIMSYLPQYQGNSVIESR